MDEICGLVESIVFQMEDTGFTVARLKVRGAKDGIVVRGIIPSLRAGETIHCKGEWRKHAQHGLQFEVQSFTCTLPTDVGAIQKYLESGMIKGIGPTYAKRIVEKFGAKTLEVIESNPELLYEVEGIGEKRGEKIVTSWQDQKEIRNIMIFLRGHGIGNAVAHKIYKKYGDKSVEKLRQNPYLIAREIHGIGFKSADQIAKQLGFTEDSPLRLAAAIEFLLWELSQEGHTYAPKEFLFEKTAEMLELGTVDLEQPLVDLAEQKAVFVEEERVAIRMLALSEKGIAREVQRLATHGCSIRPVHGEKALEWVAARMQIDLAEEQKASILQGVSAKFLVITGGPGTGKSTITKAILQITEKISDKILLAAPTGRAAKRMSEINKKFAQTIHALLEVDFQAGGFKKGKEDPLDCDLLIIDEASMVDTFLMYSLLRAIPSHARVIIIGDIDQLPSVGPGNILRDCIDSGKIPVIRLTKIFRQAGNSQIVVNAHRINNGEFPFLQHNKHSDFDFIEHEDPAQIMETIKRLITVDLPKNFRFNRFEDIQVLAPMKKGVVGIENLNTCLQAALNPGPLSFHRFGQGFRVGDKVIQMKNNYQKVVFNGDVGTIVDADITEHVVSIRFGEKIVEYESHELDEISLAYAISIHKYQGSECPCVIIPIHTSHFKLLQRNLLYTGITRGKRRVIVVGSKKAIAMAVHNEEVKKRFTHLKEALIDVFASDREQEEHDQLSLFS